MRTFDKDYILTEIINRYRDMYPNVGDFNAALTSYGYRNNEKKEFFNVFICITKDSDVIGFAVHYALRKILRFYSYDGEDMGLETDVVFKSIHQGKVMGKFKL